MFAANRKRSSISKLGAFAFLVVATLVLRSPGAAATGPAGTTAPHPIDGATLLNSGSTNSAPYRIALHADGTAVVSVEGHTPETHTISAATAAAFFAHLKAALPLVKTPGACMKSASFGTSTSVLYHGNQSGDLSCPQSTHDRTLQADASAIAHEIGIPQFLPRRPVPAVSPSSEM